MRGLSPVLCNFSASKLNHVFWILIGVLLGQVVVSIWKNLFSDSITSDIVSVKEDPVVTKEIDFCQNDLASLLERNIKILCLVVTTKKYHSTKAEAVKKTWGQGCTKLVFISDEADRKLPAIKMSSENDWDHLWAKTYAGFHWAKWYSDDYDWFLKADDDSFLIMENLRALLVQMKPSSAYYIGHPYLNQTLFNSGGAGYLLSRKALVKLNEEAFDNNANCSSKTEVVHEDNEMGRCLEAVGVLPIDTRDENERHRFFQLHPDVHLIPGAPIGFACEWTEREDVYPVKQGPDCCSDLAISFHHIEPIYMYQLYYFVNRVHLFGRHICANSVPTGTRFKKYYEDASKLLKYNYHS